MLSQKPEQEAAKFFLQQEFQEAKKTEKQKIQDLIAYGTRGKYGLPSSTIQHLSPANNVSNPPTSSSGWLKKWGSKAFNYFSGK